MLFLVYEKIKKIKFGDEKEVKDEKENEREDSTNFVGYTNL